MGRIHLWSSPLDTRSDAWRHRSSPPRHCLGHSHRWPFHFCKSKAQVLRLSTWLGSRNPKPTFFLRLLPCPYFTGDLPAHDVWMQSQDTNIHVAKVFFPQIQNSQFQIETNRYWQSKGFPFSILLHRFSWLCKPHITYLWRSFLSSFTSSHTNAIFKKDFLVYNLQDGFLTVWLFILVKTIHKNITNSSQNLSATNMRNVVCSLFMNLS